MITKELYDKSQSMMQELDMREKAFKKLEKRLQEFLYDGYNSLFYAKDKLSHAKGKKRIRELQDHIVDLEEFLDGVYVGVKDVAVNLHQIETIRKNILELDLSLPTC